MTQTYLTAFTVSLFAALTITPVARRVAVRFGALDLPAERKVHSSPVPYLGGMAIILGFVAAVLAGGLVQGLGSSLPQVAAILGGGVALAGVGLRDDLKEMPGWIKISVEVALASVLFVTGVRAELFQVGPLDLILTLGWVLGVTNAINYLDNMDGLTAGVSVIASSYFLLLAALSGQFLVASFAAALTGCALGFLWHNRPPARIFMGDAGSLFLGFLLAALGLKLRFENVARVTFFVPVAVMAVPILDALMVSVSRIRRGLSPIHPGKDHISHRLVHLSIPPNAAVGLLYLATAACGWLGVVIAYAQPRTAYMLIGWLVAIGAFLGALLLRVEVD